MPDSTLSERLLALLDPGGEPSTNLKLRLTLSRTLGRNVSDEEFYQVRDGLIAKGLAGRLPGQGGKTFREVEAAPAPAEVEPGKGTPWPEHKLMAVLKGYLTGPFQRSLELPEAAFVVQDTSKAGPPTGVWERPDFTVVSVFTHRFLPGLQVDVHSFELKTETGGGVQGVHEALSHTRQTDFGYLVWHLPSESKYADRLKATERSCLEHGVGLILIRDPADVALTEVLVDPKRRRTERRAVDAFLEARLNAENRTKLVEAIKGRSG